PTLAIRRPAFDAAGLARAALDAAFTLTADDFRVEGDLILVGPLPHPDDTSAAIDLLERAGLAYFDDFVELPASWPSWLALYARHR
nr:hypothetical protein [Gemmatimonadaceae bacterium]